MQNHVAKSCPKSAELCSNKLSQCCSNLFKSNFVDYGHCLLEVFWLSVMDATYMQSLHSSDFARAYPVRYFVLFQENTHDMHIGIFWKLGCHPKHCVSLGTDPPYQATTQQFFLSPQALKNLISFPWQTKSPDILCCTCLQ